MNFPPQRVGLSFMAVGDMGSIHSIGWNDIFPKWNWMRVRVVWNDTIAMVSHVYLYYQSFSCKQGNYINLYLVAPIPDLSILFLIYSTSIYIWIIWLNIHAHCVMIICKNKNTLHGTVSYNNYRLSYLHTYAGILRMSTGATGREHQHHKMYYVMKW